MMQLHNMQKYVSCFFARVIEPPVPTDNEPDLVILSAAKDDRLGGLDVKGTLMETNPVPLLEEIGRPRRSRVGAGLAPALATRPLVNSLMTCVMICLFALLIASCNWPGAPQTPQPDLHLKAFHVLSARIIMLDTQAEVDGTLQNASQSDRFPYDVTIVATFYNSAGNVVGQAGGVAEDVYPGMVRPFTLIGQVDSTQYSHMVVTVVSLKERRIEKIIPTPSIGP